MKEIKELETLEALETLETLNQNYRLKEEIDIFPSSSNYNNINSRFSLDTDLHSNSSRRSRDQSNVMTLSPMAQKLLDSELKTLKKLKNVAHVIHLIGYSNYHLEFDFWNRGDLRSLYLKLETIDSNPNSNPNFNSNFNSNTINTSSKKSNSIINDSIYCYDDLEYIRDWKIKMKVALQLAKGLRSIHEKGIVHGDIKSANVLLDASWNACWCDFAFSKEMDEIRKQKTILQQGTIFWMPPELLRLDNQANQSLESDIFSFGVVLWEIVELKTPYPGLNSFTVSQNVPKGYRMNLSKSPLHDLIVQTWEEDMSKRPTIQEICKILEAIKL